MSVLDTLTVIFETKGAKAVARDTKAIGSEMDSAENSAEDLVDGMKKFSASLAAVLVPLKAFKLATEAAFDFGDNANDLRLMALQAGTTTDSIQTMGNALKNYGGDAASASAVIGTLNENLQQMRLGMQEGGIQDAARRFGEFDLSGSGADGLATAEEIISSISKRMETMDEQSQIQLGKMVGFDAPMIMLAQQRYETLAEAKERASGMHVITTEESIAARKYTNQMNEMRDSFNRLKAIIGRALLPAITWISNALEKGANFFDKYRVISTVALGVIGLAFAALGIAGAAALAPLIVGMGTLAAEAIIAAAPVLAIVAAVAAIGAAIYLVIDDFKVFRAGGESEIGIIIESWQLMIDKIQEAGKAVKDFFGWDAFAGATGLDKAAPKIGQGIKDFFGWDSFANQFGKNSAIQAGASALSRTRSPLSSSLSGGSVGSSSNSVGIQEINIVTGATDANGIARDIGLSLNSEMDRILNANFSGAY